MVTMLREVLEEDLAAFFEHQRDPEATSLAVWAAREWDAFIAHWHTKVLAVPTSHAMTIVADGNVAGYVGSWESDGKTLICYWIGREYWGRGIAPSAVEEYLAEHERRRPIHAYVAQSNTRSTRVLEKCGFHRSREPLVGADGVAEVLFLLDGAI
jgi:RimJ/RimL family protein N-acetyltransferase